MSTEKNKLSLINFIFLAPAFILALDLSTQVFNAFLAIDSNSTNHQPSTVQANQVKLLQHNPNGLMNFMTNDDISNEVETIAISVDKLNVFYAGVDNPITIGTNIPRENIQLTALEGSGLIISKSSRNSYIVKASKSGSATINVTNTATGKTYPFQFRVKRIPDPIVRLGKKTDGIMGAGEFKAQQGLVAWMDGFDFDARCDIQSFTMYHTVRGQTPIEMTQSGGRFSGTVARAIQAAQPGDQYAFTNVKARCPGDKAGRRINGLSFQIK